MSDDRRSHRDRDSFENRLSAGAGWSLHLPTRERRCRTALGQSSRWRLPWTEVN